MRVAIPVLAAFVLGQAACAPRIAFQAAPVFEAATTYPVRLVTDRLPDGTADFTTTRAPMLTHLDLTVSVPPVHRPGRIEHDPTRADPARHFVVTRAETAARPGVPPPRGNPGAPVMLYVHGYNNTVAEAVYRQVQMAHDFDVEGPLVTFAWTSAETAGSYVHDRDSALVARDRLEELLRDLVVGQDRDIEIVAHSMGAMLVMETLRQMRLAGRSVSDRIAALVFLSPDIDITLFRAQLSQAAPMPRPFFVFVSQNDRALRLSSRLAGWQPRLGAPDDLAALRDAGIVVIDLTEARGGTAGGHFSAATSPDAIALINGIRRLGDGAMARY
jgi:esterase/lipase superfamily enzyme